MSDLRNADHTRSAESVASYRAECTAALTSAKSANSSAYRTAARCIMGVSAGPGARAATNACMIPLAPYLGGH